MERRSSSTAQLATTPALRPPPPARCPPETSRFISPRRIQPAHRAPPAARSLFRPSRRGFSTTKSSIGPRIIPRCPPVRLSPIWSPDLVGRSVTLDERRAHRPFDSQSTPSMGGNAARRGVDGSTGCLLRGFARSRIPEELTGIPQLYPLARRGSRWEVNQARFPIISRPTKRYASSTDPVTRTPCVRRPGCALLVAAGEQQEYGLGPSDGGPATSAGHSASLVVRVRRSGTAGTAGKNFSSVRNTLSRPDLMRCNTSHAPLCSHWAEPRDNAINEEEEPFRSAFP